MANPLSSGPVVRTSRLLLRPWREEDIDAVVALHADPRVTEYLMKALDRAECEAMAARVAAHFEEHGFGLWAVEVPGIADFIGLVGLQVPRFEARFTPCVEVGWRLAFEHWGRGYALEAAQGALDFAFKNIGLEEVVSFTVPTNTRSQQVMQRLGMTRSPDDDFDHPALPEGHPLRRHILYRIKSPHRNFAKP